MSLNKKIWAEALAHYREWNEAKLAEQVRNAGKKSIEEKWEEYKQLYAFGRLLKPWPSLWEQQRISQEWEAYYESIRRFEEWRKQHGRKIKDSVEPGDFGARKT